MKSFLAMATLGLATTPSCALATVYRTAVASPEEVAAVYPAKAREMGVEGHVRLACIGKPNGPLTDCRVAGETPPKLGFGAAALKLVPHLVMRVGFWDGGQDNNISVSIRFRLPVATQGNP